MPNTVSNNDVHVKDEPIPFLNPEEEDRFAIYEPQERLKKPQGKKLHKFRKNAF